MIDPKDVTIIIPHLGATEEQEYSLEQCLESLADFDVEQIVIGNGRSVLNNCRHRVPTSNLSLRNTIDIDMVEQGQCKATNAAAATVNTPWIFVTNDDMIYEPEWWDKLTNYPVITECVSPMLVEPRDGAPTFQVYPCGGAGGDFDKQKWLEYAKHHIGGLSTRTGFNLPFLIKKELWDLIGGYDINYDPWGSNGDSDLEYKIKLAGVQPYQNTNCIVYHFSQTSGTFHPDNDAARFNNYAYFKEKWGFDRTDQGIWEATFEIPEPPVRLYTPWWEDFYNKPKLNPRGMQLGETYGD